MYPKIFPPFFQPKFPPFGHFFIPVSHTLFIPVSDTLLSLFRIHFLSLFQIHFLSLFQIHFLSPFSIPCLSPFLFSPFPSHFYSSPKCAMHSLYCALSPTSEQDTTPAPDAAMHLCTVPCPQRQNRTQHQRIRMYSSPLV